MLEPSLRQSPHRFWYIFNGFDGLDAQFGVVRAVGLVGVEEPQIGHICNVKVQLVHTPPQPPALPKPHPWRVLSFGGVIF